MPTYHCLTQLFCIHQLHDASKNEPNICFVATESSWESQKLVSNEHLRLYKRKWQEYWWVTNFLSRSGSSLSWLAGGFRTRHVVLMINPLVLQQIYIIIFITFSVRYWFGCAGPWRKWQRSSYSLCSLNKRTD